MGTKKSKVLIFDLDDTLYPEIDFFNEGLQSVAEFIETKYELPKDEVLIDLQKLYTAHGRNFLFNTWTDNNRLPKRLIREMVSVYRQHPIKLSIPDDNLAAISNFAGNKYLVTDGNKIVQKNKINSFGLSKILKKCFITNQYGIQFQKPSLYCFDLIRQRENVDWSDLVYVGDNPSKDFVSLNSVGAITVHSKQYSDKTFFENKNHRAKFEITDLSQLRNVLHSTP